MYERTSVLLKKKFRSYLLPTIFMTMALSLGQIVDSLIVANFLERDAFSAVGLCQPVTLCFNTVFNFFAIGGATLAAICKGEKNEEKANIIFSDVLVILCIFSALFMIFGTVFIDGVAGVLCRGNIIVKEYVKKYAIALILGCPFIIIVSGTVFFVRTDGKPKLSSNVIIVSNVVNLTFDFLFVAVLKTGIIGASISTVLGYVFGGLLLIKYFKSPDRTFHIVKPDKKLFSTSLKAASSGVSSGMNTGLMFCKNLCVNLIVMGVAVLGQTGAAAFAVCNQTLTLSALFIGGTVQTILPIIGVLYGEQDKTGISMTLKTAFKFAMTFAVILVVLLEVFTGSVATIFNQTGQAREIAIKAIRMYALILPFYAFNFIIINFYQTTQKKTLAAILSALQGFAYVVPSILILSKIGDGTKLWLGFLIGEVLTSVSILIFSRIYGKKKNLKGILLESNCKCSGTMEMTIKNKIEDASKVSYEISKFCEKNNIDKTRADLACVAVEEMTENIIKYGYKSNRENYIDIYTKVIDNEVLLRIRDDGVFFNPVVYKADDMEFSGIESIKKIAKSMQYSRVLGFNTVIIKV